MSTEGDILERAKKQVYLPVQNIIQQILLIDCFFIKKYIFAPYN